MEQIELFEHKDGPEKINASRLEPQAFEKILRFKHSLLLVIYAILILVVGFVLGAEHTRRALKLKNIAQIDDFKQQALATRAVSESKVTSLAQRRAQNFIIQVATLKNQNNALLIKEALKKAGFNTYVINFKPYYKVYVGPFSGKSEAQEKLKTLKKKYPDSLIKITQ